jgi:hypothetical protein
MRKDYFVARAQTSFLFLYRQIKQSHIVPGRAKSRTVIMSRARVGRLRFCKRLN